MESYSSYVPPATNYRRLGGFIVVVVLHLFLFYALQSGLAKTLIDRVAGPIETRLIEEIKPEAEAPPPPPVKLAAPPPVYVDMPDIVITENTPTTTITNTTSEKPKVAPPPPPPPKDVVVPPRQNPRSPIAQPEYPTMSRRLGEEGAVVLLLTLDEDGRVTEATVDTSSGFERLDEAAVKEAKRPRNWKFVPGTVNGKPAPMQFKFRVVFKIEK
jgi:protein TonB